MSPCRAVLFTSKYLEIVGKGTHHIKNSSNNHPLVTLEMSQYYAKSENGVIH